MQRPQRADAHSGGNATLLLASAIRALTSQCACGGGGGDGSSSLVKSPDPRVIQQILQDPGAPNAAQKLYDAGIRHLTFDFDKTLTIRHTHGATTQEKVQSGTFVLRTAFMKLLRDALALGIICTIVTFADEALKRESEPLAGAPLIRAIFAQQGHGDLLDQLTYICFYPTLHERLDEVLPQNLRSAVMSFLPAGALATMGVPDNKLPHLLFAMLTHSRIPPNAMLYLDDDPRNVETAAKLAGVLSCLVRRDGQCVLYAPGTNSDDATAAVRQPSAAQSVAPTK